MPIKIVEVMRRSEQGVTRPFICRGEDGHTYFVKGRSAGRHSLIAEYICGRLAKSFGLPIADFEIVEIPEQLIRAGLHPDIADLGSGLAFGSRSLPHVQEILISQISEIPLQICKDVMVFDWWIRNQDRTLTEKGGNPNLLWNLASEQLVVIDHNVAFDVNFDKNNFKEGHIFARYIPTVFDDLVERASYQERLQTTFAEYAVACDNVPGEWWWVDDGVPALFNREFVNEFLGNFNEDNFWRIAL